MKFIFLLTLLTLLFSVTFKVTAQDLNFPSITANPKAGFIPVICDKSNKMITMLKQQFDEITALSGILNTNQNQIFQILFNPKKQTWTIILTNSKGVSCLVAAGKPLIIHNYFKVTKEEDNLENK